MKSFKTKIKTVKASGKTVFWCLTAALLLVTSAYVYLVNTAALNGVRWSKTEKDLSSIGASVSELEARYLSLKQSITLKVAYAEGFADVEAVRFISAKKVGTVASAKEI